MAERRGIKRKTFGDPMEDVSEDDLMEDDEPIQMSPEKKTSRENLAYWLDRINTLTGVYNLRVDTPGIESIIESLEMSSMLAPENADDMENEKCAYLMMCCFQAGIHLRNLSM